MHVWGFGFLLTPSFLLSLKKVGCELALVFAFVHSLGISTRKEEASVTERAAGKMSPGFRAKQLS